ncbi:MAG: dihydrofolate reductase family protein [Rubritepida sp.]|nr:dihydrofolate reductase family protein [Rubritepida sp.]
MARGPGAVAYIAASLDGFIATAEGGVGWLDAFQDEDFGFEAFLGGITTLAMGRVTYDQVRGFGVWPYGTRRCHVVTSRPLEADAPVGVEAWAPEELPELAARLAASEPPAWVVGGGRLIGTLLAAGSIRELDLFVMPVLLGAGVPLFAGAHPAAALELVETRSWPSGAVRLRYRVGR